jgi:hypothetical protein
MSADIEKLAVYDSRIVQQRPKYAVEKGALSLTNAPFNAISATSSQHTYNVYVPSENVFVDRGIHWTSQVFLQFTVTVAGTITNGMRVVNWGNDIALTAFPLNSLCSTITATINDTTSVINSGDVLKEVLRLTDLKDNRRQRMCPTMLDKFLYYADGQNCPGDTVSGFENGSIATDLQPNGAYPDVVWTAKDGTPLRGSGVLGIASGKAIGWYNASTGVVNYFTVVGATYSAATPAWTYATGDYGIGVDGTPIFVVEGGVSMVAQAQTVYCRFRSTEKLVLSPFVFSDIHEADTGLFGINNIQLIMNLNTDVTRIIRSKPNSDTSGVTSRLVSSVSVNTNQQSGGFANSRVNCIFLTPSLDVPLPPKSVVPYMEFPRYITNYSGGISAGSTAQLQSQTITLPQIPDLFVIYAKPTFYTTTLASTGTVDPTQGDWYFPPASQMDGVNNPLSVNFDNFSGLLSSTSAEQLYEMSVHNGLDMSYAQWLGAGHSSLANALNTVATGLIPPAQATTGQGDVQFGTTSGLGGYGRVPLTGGFLVLKPGKDITLQTGQAPSLVGNFTFQFNLTVKNNTTLACNAVSLYVVTVNSGFFESIRGSSRIIKGVLSEQDIISAPTAPTGTRAMLARWTGSGMGASLANCLSKTPDAPRVAGAGAGAGTGAGAGGKMPKGLSARLR